MEVSVEIAAVRRDPLELPAHAFLERLDLRQRRPRDHHHRDVAGCQVWERAVNMVGHERAAWTAFLPIRSEHEVVNDQLAASGEQLGERYLAPRRIEVVVLLKLHPRQLAPLGAQLVAQPGEFFLLPQQLLAGRDPFLARRNFGFLGQCVGLHVGHNIFLSLLVVVFGQIQKNFRDGGSQGRESILSFTEAFGTPSSCSGLGLAHGAHFAAGGTAAVEDTGAVRLQTGYGDASGHLQALEDLARLRIDAAELALLGFQGAVPELAVHPGNARDEAIRINRAQDRAGLGVDLADLAGAILSDPERPLGPGQARVAAVGRCRDGGHDLARAGVDLLDAVVGQLPQVLAVESSAGVGGDRELADQRAALGIERDDALAAREPDVRAVEGHAVDLVHTGIGAVFAEDLRLPGLTLSRRLHDPRLTHR